MVSRSVFWGYLQCPIPFRHYPTISYKCALAVTIPSLSYKCPTPSRLYQLQMSSHLVANAPPNLATHKMGPNLWVSVGRSVNDLSAGVGAPPLYTTTLAVPGRIELYLLPEGYSVQNAGKHQSPTIGNEWGISIALLRSKCCSTELSLRVELICAVWMHKYLTSLRSVMSSALNGIFALKCGNAIKIHQWNKVQFLPRTATYRTNLYWKTLS